MSGNQPFNITINGKDFDTSNEVKKDPEPKEKNDE